MSNPFHDAEEVIAAASKRIDSVPEERLNRIGWEFRILLDELKRLKEIEKQGLVCAFCGEARVLPATSQEARQSMAAHIMQCEKHPMRKLVEECARLTEACEIFEKNSEGAAQMEIEIRSLKREIESQKSRADKAEHLRDIVLGGSPPPVPMKTFLEGYQLALEENKRLREAITYHHSQKGDDRCIEDDDLLYEAAGLPPVDRRVGDKRAMLKNCERFIDKRCESGGWKTYAELEKEVADLKKLQKETATMLEEAYRQLGAETIHEDSKMVARACLAGPVADLEDAMGQITRLSELNVSLADRVAAQSSLLTKRAEKSKQDAKALAERIANKLFEIGNSGKTVKYLILSNREEGIVNNLAGRFDDHGGWSREPVVNLIEGMLSEQEKSNGKEEDATESHQLGTAASDRGPEGSD